MSDRVLSAGAGEKLCILGNEAIARGALEAGVRFVSGYPGTPASEIGDVFSRCHREVGADEDPPTWYRVDDPLGFQGIDDVLRRLPGNAVFLLQIGVGR